MLDFPLWKRVLILTVCALGIVYAAPNVLPAGVTAGLPGWLPGQRVNLGLDLRGGAHLLFEVETDVVLEERLEDLVSDVRLAMREARLRYARLEREGGRIILDLRDAADAARARDLIRDVDARLEVDAPSPERLALALGEQAAREEAQNAVTQSIEVIRRRIDEDGTKEPLIQRQGANRILVQVPGAEDTEAVKRKVGRTAKMTFHLVNPSVSPADMAAGRLPPGTLALPSAETLPNGSPERMYAVERRVRVSGEHLTNAQSTFDQNNRPAVSFQFDTAGGRRFGAATSENVGRLLAIVLDGRVISAPEIQQPIVGGTGIITGRFSVQETQELSLLLRAGALPAPLTVLEERSVGPGLGRDSIEAGAIAALLGLALVVAFMAASYGLFGLMANAALAINLTLIFAALSALQATLTLPGIAGIVLTIGMAVDANVLVFERIREEIRNGRPPVGALEAGYKRALTTIIDSNLTTLIAALLLFMFGSGPVKGFAVTLSIGIVTSMFTAIMVTRWLAVAWTRRRRPKALPI